MAVPGVMVYEVEGHSTGLHLSHSSDSVKTASLGKWFPTLYTQGGVGSNIA